MIVEAAVNYRARFAACGWMHSIGGESPGIGRGDGSFFAPFDSNFVEQTRTFVRSMFAPSADTALMSRVATDMSSAPPAVAMSAMRNAFRYDERLPGRLAELKLPVVAINADLFPTDTASMAAHGAQVITMPGVGHFLLMEDRPSSTPCCVAPWAGFPSERLHRRRGEIVTVYSASNMVDMITAKLVLDGEGIPT